MKFKANPEIDYIELLGNIGSVIPVCEYKGTEICLRHDVDHDLNHAFIMANLEAENKIRSTYYILPPEFNKVNYYGKWEFGYPTLSEHTRFLIRQISDLGHEIGLHSNLVTLCLQSNKEPYQLMNHIVKDFENAGIKLKTTASHGDSGARNGGYINYQVFEEMGEKKFPFLQIKLSDYGLTEAYNLKRVHYVSDSGGIFALCTQDGIEKSTEREKVYDFVKDIVIPSQILLHPIWWI